MAHPTHQSDSTNLDSDCDDIVDLPPLAKHVNPEAFDPLFDNENASESEIGYLNHTVNFRCSSQSVGQKELGAKDQKDIIKCRGQSVGQKELDAVDQKDLINVQCRSQSVGQKELDTLDRKDIIDVQCRSHSVECVSDHNYCLLKSPLKGNFDGREKNIFSTCDCNCQEYFVDEYAVKLHMKCHGFSESLFKKSQSAKRKKSKWYNNDENMEGCDICKEHFSTDIELMVHKQDDHGVCSVCNITLPSCDTLQQHLDTHSDPTLQRCLICGSGFLARVALLYHIKDQHTDPCHHQTVYDTIYECALQTPESGPYVFHFKCPFCLSNFSQKQKCFDHIKTHRFEIKCKQCPEKFKHRKYLLEHLFKHSQSDSIQCDVCMRYLTRGWIKKHSVCDKLIMCCRRCGLAFENTFDLIEHMMKHFMRADLKCYKCEKTFGNKQSFKRHHLHHEERRHYKCEICSIVYLNEKHLNKHTEEKHMQVEESEKFVCELCLEKFNCKSLLTKHMANFHRPKTIKCQYCCMMFHSKYKASRHEVIHTGEQKYKCDVCQKTFSQSSGLISHKVMHSDFRAHKCSECDKSFKTKSQLKYHMFTHTGQRPYVCDICGKGFTNETHKKTHMRTHTGETPYLCQHCGAAYPTNGQLQRHVLTHQ